MNFFEQQLRQIFEDEFENAKYIGRACYISFSDGSKVKAELVTTKTANEYDTLRLRAFNHNNGESDTLLLRFSDYFSPSRTYPNSIPYIWTYNEKTKWYQQPTAKELDNLTEAAYEYVRMFDPEQTEGITME